MSTGKMPSPILPDGTLLSISIPGKDIVSYAELEYESKSYLSI